MELLTNMFRKMLICIRTIYICDTTQFTRWCSFFLKKRNFLPSFQRIYFYIHSFLDCFDTYILWFGIYFLYFVFTSLVVVVKFKSFYTCKIIINHNAYCFKSEFILFVHFIKIIFFCHKGSLFTLANFVLKQLWHHHFSSGLLLSCLLFNYKTDDVIHISKNNTSCNTSDQEN